MSLFSISKLLPASFGYICSKISWSCRKRSDSIESVAKKQQLLFTFGLGLLRFNRQSCHQLFGSEFLAYLVYHSWFLDQTMLAILLLFSFSIGMHYKLVLDTLPLRCSLHLPLFEVPISFYYVKQIGVSIFYKKLIYS